MSGKGKNWNNGMMERWEKGDWNDGMME